MWLCGGQCPYAWGGGGCTMNGQAIYCTHLCQQGMGVGGYVAAGGAAQDLLYKMIDKRRVGAVPAACLQSVTDIGYCSMYVHRWGSGYSCMDWYC